MTTEIKNRIKYMGVEQRATNQVVLYIPEGSIFQSYRSKVAFVDTKGNITVGRNWDYSRTTMKHLGRWLGLNAKEIREGIKDGSIVYDEDLI